MISLQNPTSIFYDKPLYKTGMKDSAPTSKKVTVLCETSSSLTDEEKIQMLKILSACKIAEHEMQLLVTDRQHIALRELKITSTPNRLLIFGNMKLGLNMDLPKNKTIHLGSWYILQTDSLLKMLKATPTEKQKLWTQLQVLFQLSA